MTSVVQKYDFYRQQQRFALLVGVDRYADSNFGTLKFCRNDVQALEKLLTQLGYYVTCFYDDHPNGKLPTIEAVEDALATFCQTVGKEDLAFVHFSCHGDAYETKTTEGMKQKSPVLVMQNTYKNSYAKRALHVAELEKQLREIGAKDMFLSLDACHVGMEVGRDAADPEFIKYICQDSKGFAMLAGSTAQQKAQESNAIQHGVYTYYLLKGLSGEAGHAKDNTVVTVSSLQDYVLKSLKVWRLEHGCLPQEPTRKVEGTGDMMLACWQGLERTEFVATSVESLTGSAPRSEGIATLSNSRRQQYETDLNRKNKALDSVNRDLAGPKTQEQEDEFNARKEQLLDNIEKLEQILQS
jgi:Caspase domain